MSELSSNAGVSIVIPHYGDPSVGRALVGSLLAQPTRRPVEIIVVDDNYPEPFPELDQPSCTVLRRETNGGFGITVNTGAAAAIHPLLLILNSDLTLGPSFIEDLCEGAQPWMPAVAGPTIVDPKGVVQQITRRFPTITSSALAALTPAARLRDRRFWQRAIGCVPVAANTPVTICDWFWGAAMLIPTEEFRRLGGFDERFFMNSEEVDLQRRAQAIGMPSVVLNELRAEHAGAGSSDQSKRLAWLMEGEWLYHSKWNGRFHARLFQVALFAIALINLAWNSLRSIAGRPTRPLETFRRFANAIRHASHR